MAASWSLSIYAISLDDYSRLGYSFEVMAALAAASAAGAMLIPKLRARPST